MHILEVSSLMPLTSEGFKKVIQVQSVANNKHHFQLTPTDIGAADILQEWFTPPTSAKFCFIINCIQMGTMDSNEDSKRANVYK